MDRDHVSKYFKNQCTDKELHHVLNWFQSEEGRKFLETQIDKDSRWLIENRFFFSNPEVATGQIFNRIQQSTNNSHTNSRMIRNIATLIIIAAITSFVLYLQNQLVLLALLAACIILWIFVSKIRISDIFKH